MPGLPFTTFTHFSGEQTRVSGPFRTIVQLNFLEAWLIGKLSKRISYSFLFGVIIEFGGIQDGSITCKLPASITHFLPGNFFNSLPVTSLLCFAEAS